MTKFITIEECKPENFTMYLIQIGFFVVQARYIEAGRCFFRHDITTNDYRVDEDEVDFYQPMPSPRRDVIQKPLSKVDDKGNKENLMAALKSAISIIDNESFSVTKNGEVSPKLTYEAQSEFFSKLKDLGVLNDD